MHNEYNIICYLLLYDIEIEGVNIIFFFYKSPHTTHATPHWPSHRRRKDLYWYPHTLPCTVQPG